MTEAKRIAIEVDRHELAALMRFHSAALGKMGEEFAHSIVSPDQDDLEWARRVAERLQELFAVSQQFIGFGR